MGFGGETKEAQNGCMSQKVYNAQESWSSTDKTVNHSHRAIRTFRFLAITLIVVIIVLVVVGVIFVIVIGVIIISIIYRLIPCITKCPSRCRGGRWTSLDASFARCFAIF